MATYTFRGRDMSDAVAQVRDSLGSDAVIIDTLRGNEQGVRFVEITARGQMNGYGSAEQPVSAAAQLAQSYQGDRYMGGAGAYGTPAPVGMRPPAPRGAQPRSAPLPPRGDSIGRRAVPPGVGEAQIPSPGQANQQRMRRNQEKLQRLLREAKAGRSPNVGSAVSALQQATGQHPPSSDLGRPAPPQAARTRTAGAAYQPNRPAPPAHPQRPRATSPGAPTRLTPPRPQRTAAPITAPHAHGASPGRPSSRPADPLRSQRQHTPAPGRGAGSAQPRRPAAPQQRAQTPTGAGLAGQVNTVQQMMQGGGDSFVRLRLNEIADYIRQSQTHGGMSGPVFEHLRALNLQLRAAGIDPKLADALIEETKATLHLNQLDRQTILAHLGTVLAQKIDCVDPLSSSTDGKRVLAFVGPTGVGKTTTIAKIAAHAHLTHEIAVTLISTDTFRMAAIEQLGRYAEILDCDVHAARSPEELKQLVDAAQTPLVLVDTTGRNPRVAGQLKSLAQFFLDHWGGDTILTMAANTRERDMREIIKGFKPLGYNMVSMTKLDETYAMGSLYNITQLTGCPLAWTTHGQRVPEDIELASPEKLAVRIIMEALSQKPEGRL